MSIRFILGVLAYLVPSFVIAFAWHLVIFTDYYARLHIYREDMIVPFGFASMILQGAFYAWLYRRVFAGRTIAGGAPAFGSIAAVLAWSYSVLPVAAKFPMTSVPDFMIIETAFTAVQFAAVAPAMAAVYRKGA